MTEAHPQNSLATPAQADQAQQQVASAVAMTAAAPLIEAKAYTAARDTLPAFASESSLVRAATKSLDKAGLQYDVGRTADGDVVMVINSGDSQNWLANVAPKLRDKYNVEIRAEATRPEMVDGTTIASVTTDEDKTIIMGFPVKSVANPDTVRPTINHELVHVKNEKSLLENGENTGLMIMVRSKGIGGGLGGIPMPSYRDNFRMDEVEAFYKGARAAEDMARKVASSDPKAAKAFLAEAQSQRESAGQAAKASQDLLKQAEQVIKTGDPSHLQKGANVYTVQLPRGPDQQKMEMDFALKETQSVADARAAILKQIEKAQSDVSYYIDRLAKTAPAN